MHPRMLWSDDDDPQEGMGAVNYAVLAIALVVMALGVFLS